MSDQGVRKLAEEIAEDKYPRLAQNNGVRVECASRWERRLTAFLTEREADLHAQLHRALGEGAGLRNLLKVWWGYYGSTRGVPESLDRETDAALTSSPLSERAGAVLVEAGRLVDDARDRDVSPTVEGWSCDRLIHAVDALRAELQGGGEGG